MHIWSNSIWNLLEPILWHSCKWFTEVSAEKSLSSYFKFLKFITLMYEHDFIFVMNLTLVCGVINHTQLSLFQLYLIAGKLYFKHAKNVSSCCSASETPRNS